MSHWYWSVLIISQIHTSMSINPAADNFLLITSRLASLVTAVVSVSSAAGFSLDGGGVESASLAGEDRSSFIVVADSIALFLYIMWKSGIIFRTTLSDIRHNVWDCPSCWSLAYTLKYVRVCNVSYMILWMMTRWTCMWAWEAINVVVDADMYWHRYRWFRGDSWLRKMKSNCIEDSFSWYLATHW